mgnify:CR=1 FL=1
MGPKKKYYAYIFAAYYIYALAIVSIKGDMTANQIVIYGLTGAVIGVAIFLLFAPRFLGKASGWVLFAIFCFGYSISTLNAFPTDSQGLAQQKLTSVSSSHVLSRQVDERFNGFTVLIPEGWIRRTDIDLQGAVLAIQATAKGRISNCNVRSKYSDQFLSVSGADYLEGAFPGDDVSELLASYKAVGINPQLLQSERIDVSGTKGMFVEFDFVSGSMKLRTLNVQFLMNGFLYTIGCTDTSIQYPHSLPEFQLFLSSFQSIAR